MSRFDGVIFDMDGTLIEPLLDFSAIRADLAIPQGLGILEAIDAMPPARGSEVRRRLLAHELAAARRAKLMPGAAEVVRAVRGADLRSALLTRNAREAMELVLERFAELRFDLTWSRENGPIKPGPMGMLRACRELGIEPARTACVGDFHYDITAANDAGAVSVLLVHGDPPEWSSQADHVITSLHDLPALLEIPPGG